MTEPRATIRTRTSRSATHRHRGMLLGTRRAAVLTAALALGAALFSGLPSGPDASAATASDPSAASSMVTFTAEGSASTVRANLRCDDRLVAVAALPGPERSQVTREAPASSAGLCHVQVETSSAAGSTEEIGIEVRSAQSTLERHVQHSDTGVARSKPFDRGEGDLTVHISTDQLGADDVGTGLRVMTFNIYLGGQLDANAQPGWAEENLRQLTEFVRSEDPDVLFLVETYGAGELIEQALNTDQPAGREFTGVQVTREDDFGANGDNLWLYTSLDVQEVYPPISGQNVSTFHFGGARLGLPDGGHVHAFSSWLHHQDSARTAANRAATETVLGQCRTDTDEQVIAVDEVNRAAMAHTILTDYLPEHVTDGGPVLIGGDFNTLSHLDWSELHSHAPGHEGLVLDWPVTAQFDNAGFIDTYRHVHPDVRRYPGRTMDTIHGYLYAPDRIDYLLARGEQVRILGSRTHTERMAGHRGQAMGEAYPFYSDHAAVVTDVVIAGSGPGFQRDVVEEPSREEQHWPDPPAGYEVPSGALSATASNAQATRPADNAVDGDPSTHWATEDGLAGSQELTVDLGESRELSALRYLPRVDSNFGMVLRGTLQASDDGTEFTDVADIAWDRYNRPEDIELDDLTTRYLRLQVDLSSGPMTAAAQIIPYQTSPPEQIDPPAGSVETIVAPGSHHDDCTPAYQETGPWISSNLAGHDGAPTRYSDEPGATAQWVPELHAQGRYEVAIWWPAHETTTTEATYAVTSTEGTAEVTIDPREQAGDWHSLGTWDFAEGTHGQLVLTVGSGYHRAAAVRFSPVDDLDR